MSSLQTKPRPAKVKSAFTLVELLVVIAIISILMTAGSIGLSGIGGKGVTSGVANAEALFNEARSTAVGKNLRACLLVAKKLNDNPADDLRRIIVAYEPVDPATGEPTTAKGEDVADWVLSSRGTVLPDQTFFSSALSKMDQSGAGGSIRTVTLSNVKNAYKGAYYVYEFNSQGILIDPTVTDYRGGASFVIGTGARSLSKPADDAPPKVTGSAKRDFGGFVVWRNGSTSVFRSPDQISTSLPDAGKPF